MPFFRIPKDPYRNEQDAKVSAIEALIANLQGRGEEADAESRKTTEQLYGDDIDRMRRSVDANASRTRSTMARSNMARGGDASGVLAANLMGVDEQQNRTTGDRMMDFNRLADGKRERSAGRADRLMGSVMGAESGLLNRFDNKGGRDQMMHIQRNQARGQFWSDLLGTGLSFGGKLL